MNKGAFYEGKACKYLRMQGYKILKRNFRSPFGEIDIVAQKTGCISFVEVKARSFGSLASGLEAVNSLKIKKIRKTALFYAKGKDKNYRFDVLEIIKGRDYLQYNLLENAFNMTD